MDAFDTTPLEVPAPWGGLPVTPALVEWSDGRGWHTVVDFRATLPCASYSSVYAPGTTKNWIRRPGRYLFAAPSVPARAVRVRVVDTAGNSATATIGGSARVVRPAA